ncbi:MAG: hypothetical protein GY859_00740 [Desulfobacterales bacterium]|nr:hypothetical protein [Desulfobacterales bacterium]
MAKIVNLRDYKNQAAAQRGFGPWRYRFGESFGPGTTPADLSDKTLYHLAMPGEDGAGAFYEFIMSVLEYHHYPSFDSLDKKRQLLVMDIHLFLADQVRFEVMRRLGWLENLPVDRFTLTEMVFAYDNVRSACKGLSPELSPSHPGYEEFCQLTRGDKEVFIRQMLQEALDTFGKQSDLK